MRYICKGMTRVFDMDDRARLPWRFFGATLTVLSRP
ncbi:MAG: isopropylmalate isomerase [Roseovarius sp.]|nr:isopropylmalate isomerase [Roseovarius sp.]